MKKMLKKDIFISGLIKKTGLTSSEIKKIVLNCCQEIDHNLVELSIAFVNEEKMVALNTQYLNHNYPTDILTFDLSDDSSGSEGEIIISIDEAVSNSARFKVEVKEEIKRLIIHGVLHLSGLDDATAEQKRFMRRKENFLLKKVAENE